MGKSQVPQILAPHIPLVWESQISQQDFEKVVFGQDQQVVESQRPEQVPFDLADELHLPFDAVAINYRRTMQKQGLAYYHYLHETEEEA